MINNNDSDGFTIVELLITLIIIGTAFGAFMVSFTTIQNIHKKAIDIAEANSIAFAKVESYENTNYSSLPSTTPSGTLQEVEDFSSSLPTSFEAPRVGKVYINTVSDTLKHIVVTVEFGSGDSKRTVQYANFIQRNGIGR
ncbi:type II secretion system protein [Candidatus Saccharibacteria bacterium]|nr:type II secretion system protein [Candidatus Saccharibacteria bacterium]